MNKKPTKLTPEEKYWEEVDHLAQAKIYQLLIKNIPFQNTPLIKEPWNYEERQQKLTGLFLTRDADYGLLLSDIENQYAEELPAQEYLAEEVAFGYCRLVIKSLMDDLSNYSTDEPSYF